MRIVHVINSLAIGGREKVVIELCNEMAEKHEVTIITLSNNNNSQVNNLNSKIDLIELPFGAGLLGMIKLWVFGYFSLVGILRKISPEIIHNHLYYHFYLLIALVNRKVKSNSFRTVHTSGLFYTNQNLINNFRLWLEKVATKIDKPNMVSISRAIFNNNEQHFKSLYSRNRYIPNGIDFAELERRTLKFDRIDYSINVDDFVGVYVARFDSGKNHSMIIEVVEELRRLNYNVKFLFVGDGVLREEFEKMINDKNLQQHILLTGFTSNVGSFLRLSDFAVFPSEFEGFPLSLIEKMYYKLPVVASNIDVFLEVIADNVNGLIFHLDDPIEFRDKIIFLYNNRTELKLMGENAKESALAFDVKNVAQDTLNYYNLVCDVN